MTGGLAGLRAGAETHSRDRGDLLVILTPQIDIFLLDFFRHFLPEAILIIYAPIARPAEVAPAASLFLVDVGFADDVPR